jgi:hypothetical protein
MDEFEHALKAFTEATGETIKIKVNENNNTYSTSNISNSAWDIHFINSSDKKRVTSHSRFKFAFNYYKKYS